MRRKKYLMIAIVILISVTSGFISNTVQGADLDPYPVLVGLYPSAELYTSVDEINTYDADFGGDVFSIAGTFIDIESPDWFINAELAAAWNNGYIPFVNLGSGGEGIQYTAEEIANGALDAAIRNWANLFEFFANGLYEDRRAFIAPLQENNGGYASYSGDPENFIKAYLRIQQIFLEEGVPEDSVSWVYAPNGWHNATTGYPFEEGYPGDSAVDVVAFSSFNWGTCFSFSKSESYEDIYEPYLDRMRIMAPGKPIMIAEIGSVTEGLDRGAWFLDTLTKIGNYPAVTGVLYFSKLENPYNEYEPGVKWCDEIDHRLEAGDKTTIADEGLAEFQQVVTQPPYGYWEPSSVEMTRIAFDRPVGVFEDVWPASTWSEQTDIYYQSWVERLAVAGITGGCNITTIDLDPVTEYVYRYYCPEDTVTRAQMSIFLLRSKFGTGYSPDPATGTRFEDVIPGDEINDWADDWIEALAGEGITGGCSLSPPLYCPDSPVTRAQMSIFLLRSKYGAGFSPDPATGTRFDDIVPDDGINDWADDWIEVLAGEGITGGCSANPPLYCPDNPVTRGDMAIFLVRTFSLP